MAPKRWKKTGTKKASGVGEPNGNGTITTEISAELSSNGVSLSQGVSERIEVTSGGEDSSLVQDPVGSLSSQASSTNGEASNISEFSTRTTQSDLPGCEVDCKESVPLPINFDEPSELQTDSNVGRAISPQSYLNRRTSYCDPVEAIYSVNGDGDAEFESMNPLQLSESKVEDKPVETPSPAKESNVSGTRGTIQKSLSIPSVGRWLYSLMTVYISGAYQVSSLAASTWLACVEFGVWAMFKLLCIPYWLLCLQWHLVGWIASGIIRFAKSMVLSLVTVVLSFALMILNNTPGSTHRIPKVLNGYSPNA